MGKAFLLGMILSFWVNQIYLAYQMGKLNRKIDSLTPTNSKEASTKGGEKTDE